ncbi:hypothetical protein [Abyssogena phaseoliformis symbiont]|uniref:hypothetical protein n=1 Tax=Abyssogena phaseoliformis symbiont TaxID=596095 RepID=UPI0019164C0B|nr:hypothetical protein [Abyssogena phaseoliformis symbiont]
MQVIVHFNNQQVSSLSGYNQKLSAELKYEIDASFFQGKTNLNTAEVLDFISQDLLEFKILSNKAVIIPQASYVIWRVNLVINGMETIYIISDSHPPQLI